MSPEEMQTIVARLRDTSLGIDELNENLSSTLGTIVQALDGNEPPVITELVKSFVQFQNKLTANSFLLTTQISNIGDKVYEPEEIKE